MAAKTEMLKCELDTKGREVVMYHALRKGDEWSKREDSATVVFNVDLLPEAIATQCLLYGVRAKLQDSCSDFRKYGIAQYMEGMRAMFDEVLVQGEWNKKATGRGAQMDMALVAVIARKKKISVQAAESALKKLEKDQREALAEKFKKEIDAERKKMTNEVSLEDLL